MSDMNSIFISQAVLWVVLTFFLHRLIKSTKKAEQQIEELLNKSGIDKKENR